ncbi:MAG: hypothetical protein EPN22_16390 [Nitrospirae bacterium]|nr:MAG: hypothetical protein EPN22_16390 [Nitrospirota bacterium]
MKELDTDCGNTLNILRTVVFLVSLIAGSSAVYYYYIVETNSIEEQWGVHCSKYSDPSERSNCMILSVKLISEFKDLLRINILIAFAVPILFFGGLFVYKRLANKSKDCCRT